LEVVPEDAAEDAAEAIAALRVETSQDYANIYDTEGFVTPF